MLLFILPMNLPIDLNDFCLIRIDFFPLESSILAFSQSKKAVNIFAIILLENLFSSRFLEDTVTEKFFMMEMQKK